MSNHLALSLVAALAAFPLPAQEDDQILRAVLLVQFGPGDLVLNRWLIDAMLNEPACRNGLERVLSGALVEIKGLTTDLPAPHLAGTFQLHFDANLRIRGKLSVEQQDAAIDAIVGHLQRRLDQVLFEQPRQQLTIRRDELDRRHAELQAQRAHLLARAEAATSTLAMLQQHRNALEQQQLAARIDAATETRGREHIEMMLAEATKRRDERRAQIVHHDTELAAQMSRLNELSTTVPATQEEREKLRAGIAPLQAEVQNTRNRIDHLKEAAEDQQRMLAVVLEQLPASAVAKQRADARLQGLHEEQKALEDRITAATAARAEAAQFEAEAERLQIDITVSRTMLTEIQGKLARLQPVHYELMRQRF